MKYQKESFRVITPEAKPLWEEHYKEIAHYQDIPLDVDFDRYHALEDMGVLNIWTARDADGKLVGYAFYFVNKNGHYRGSLQAVQDILFVRKENRGLLGAKLIKHCDEELRKMGVQVVYHHVKKEHNFGPLLERMGYTLVDLIYGRRLDLKK